ncbi:hypothetical protein ABIE56_000334 [Luteibacter sp. 621]|uniref:hypothetical protein n=1 Tax=Luteibacter sp. 621 TaxID=3373916 RepID=UPI003D1DC293
MKPTRQTPSAKDMRAYFADIGFTLRHHPATSDAPQTWWLADGDGSAYPMPAAFRPAPGQPIVGPVPEVEDFSSLPRLWRAWATTVYRFAREAHCIELIKERVLKASDEERREVSRWARSGASCWPDSVRPDAPSLDIDGNEVDESVWPWSAMRWYDSLSELVAEGWPWTAVPLSFGDGLAVQRVEGWPEQAEDLSCFDTRYPDTYFEAVQAVLAEVLPELVHDTGEDDGTWGGEDAEGMGPQPVDAEVGGTAGGGAGVGAGIPRVVH